MSHAQLGIEILKLLLSPQVVIGSCVVLFIFWFRSEVRGLMVRVARIKFGGAELDTSQAQRLESTEAPKPAQLTLTLAGTPKKEEEATDAATLRQRLDAERARAAVWEYRYLNHFLARATQVVLDWFASLTVRTSKSMYDTYWTPGIMSAREREAIITALEAHHLIQIKDDLIEVTPKGREYIGWRGPLPKNG